MHEVLVNRLGGLSLPRKSVVRLTDRPDMTLDVYRGRKTTVQPTKSKSQKEPLGTPKPKVTERSYFKESASDFPADPQNTSTKHFSPYIS